MKSRQFFIKYFQQVVGPLFETNSEIETLSDSDIRAQFERHANDILNYYRSNNLPLGNLVNYIECLRLANIGLNKYSNSLAGYTGLIRPATYYVLTKLGTGQGVVPKDFDSAVKFAKKDNAKDSDGRVPLFQVTTDAERDFILLLIEYITFYFQKKFNSKAINNGLALPKVATLMEQRVQKFQARISSYEARVAQNLESGPRSCPVTPQALTFKDSLIQQIDDYISKLTRFNRYGKRRAGELKSSIINCKSEGELQNLVETFIATGKTKSDYSCIILFAGASGYNQNSLRNMIKAVKSRFPQSSINAQQPNSIVRTVS